MTDVNKNFKLTVSHIQPSCIPVCIWNTRSSIGLPERKKIIDYYCDPALKAYSQLRPLDLFENIIILPGFWPDYGIALEASAFGCRIQFSDNNPPQPLVRFKELHSITSLKKINPNSDGLMPIALKEYRLMLKMLSKKYIKRIPYLDGSVLVTGPLEVATMLVGHERFFIGLYESPKLIHLLLDVISEGIIEWVNELKKIAGELKVLSMIEHVPGMLSEKHILEYAFPYIKRIFYSFPQAIKLYHNEDNLDHVIELLPKVGMDIFHFGDTDIIKLKKNIGNKITLMGNIHPLQVLRKGTAEDVQISAASCLKAAGFGGGYILSSGGGLAPDTPLSNLKAMVDATL